MSLLHLIYTDSSYRCSWHSVAIRALPSSCSPPRASRPFTPSPSLCAPPILSILSHPLFYLLQPLSPHSYPPGPSLNTFPLSPLNHLPHYPPTAFTHPTNPSPQETIAPYTSNPPSWSASAADTKSAAVDEMRAAKALNDNSQGSVAKNEKVGMVEEKVGGAVGCEGMVGEGRVRRG